MLFIMKCTQNKMNEKYDKYRRNGKRQWIYERIGITGEMAANFQPSFKLCDCLPTL